jgi:arginase family enzyme
MDLEFYFKPVEEFCLLDELWYDPGRLGSVISVHSEEGKFPVIDDIDIAIIGVGEDRNSVTNFGCADAPDWVRKFLYRLYQWPYKTRIADLGNMRSGDRVEDTYFALRNVIAYLLRGGTIPVVIGGSQDLTYANYLAYESMGKIINLVSIDNQFDLGMDPNVLNSNSFLSSIIMHQPNFLFNYTNIGYQTYFVEKEATELMRKLFFDAYRLGNVQADIEEVEPMVRNADLLSIDFSAIRQSDAPGNANTTPNGFYGEEVCRIMRYAGMSDKLTSVGLYEINPKFDVNGQSSHLAAQMIWYLVDGFFNLKHDFPLNDKDKYVKYHVATKTLEDQIVFYKSKKTDRWWMEVPCPSNLMTKYERHYLVPCSYKDYQTASEGDVPDRWLQAYQKIM